MQIVCVERVLIAVADLDTARRNWERAGFAVGPVRRSRSGAMRTAAFAAGAVAVELCAAENPSRLGALADPLMRVAARGGGVVGWLWGASELFSGFCSLRSGLLKFDAPEPNARHSGEKSADNPDALDLPGEPGGAWAMPGILPGLFLGATEVAGDFAERRDATRRSYGPNANTVEYLDHIVVMVPKLEEAIGALGGIGLPCRRIREAGGALRQAFFKLEQTVLEVVGPSSQEPGVWGLAFMCTDIGRAVSVARDAGLAATEPKPAVQGGRIGRIVEPLDGVAVALMEPPRNQAA